MGRLEELTGMALVLAVTEADDGEKVSKERVKEAVRNVRASWKTLMETLMRESGVGA